jgi:hypothetical protein
MYLFHKLDELTSSKRLMPILGPITSPQQWEGFHLDKSLYLVSNDVNGQNYNTSHPTRLNL